MTVAENIAFSLRHLTKQARLAQVEESLALVHLEGLGNRYPHELSGGQQQLVGIARALIGNPKLILADEPTGNVDPEMGRKIMRLFAELNKRVGTTILIATHDLELLADFDRVLVFEEGRIAVDDTPKAAISWYNKKMAL